MKRVYVAGPISSSNQAAQRIKEICAASVAWHLRKMGYAVICPHEQALAGDSCLDYEGWMRHGFAMLDACEECFVCEGWENSRGTLREIKKCIEAGTPLYYVAIFEDRIEIEDFEIERAMDLISSLT